MSFPTEFDISGFSPTLECSLAPKLGDFVGKDCQLIENQTVLIQSDVVTKGENRLVIGTVKNPNFVGSSS